MATQIHWIMYIYRRPQLQHSKSPHVLLTGGNTINQLDLLLVTLFIYVLLQGYATTPNTVCMYYT